MSQIETTDRENYDPSWLTGRALERHFSMQDALFDFSRLFQDEKNDRALAIVSGAFLDTLLENILIEFLVDDKNEVAELLRYDGPMGLIAGVFGRPTAWGCCANPSATTCGWSAESGIDSPMTCPHRSPTSRSAPGVRPSAGTARPTSRRRLAPRLATSSTSVSTSWQAIFTGTSRSRGVKRGSRLGGIDSASGNRPGWQQGRIPGRNRFTWTLPPGPFP
jgi:hypothetical protein